MIYFSTLFPRIVSRNCHFFKYYKTGSIHKSRNIILSLAVFLYCDTLRTSIFLQAEHGKYWKGQAMLRQRNSNKDLNVVV